MEDEILQVISEQISQGYYSGTFCILNDNTEKYVDVNWSLEVNTYEDEE